MPKRGLEPPHPCEYMTLNHARLPIPPLRQRAKSMTCDHVAICTSAHGATLVQLYAHSVNSATLTVGRHDHGYHCQTSRPKWPTALPRSDSTQRRTIPL